MQCLCLNLQSKLICWYAVWESVEAASELRSGKDAASGVVGSRDRKFDDAEDEGTDAGFQVMGARKDTSKNLVVLSFFVVFQPHVLKTVLSV
jgi:hypothetical protein